MTPEEAEAVRYALTHERNPTHLAGFASTLQPEEAVAASLLFARAQILERRRELGKKIYPRLLDMVSRIASTPPSAAVRRSIAGEVEAVRSYGAATGASVDHAILGRASDMIASPGGVDLSALPGVVQNAILALIVPIFDRGAPPIAILHPMAAVLLRADPRATTPDQREHRARWVWQYLREQSLRGRMRTA